MCTALRSSFHALGASRRGVSYPRFTEEGLLHHSAPLPGAPRRAPGHSDPVLRAHLIPLSARGASYFSGVNGPSHLALAFLHGPVSKHK